MRTRGAVSIRRALVPSGRFIGTWTATVRTARMVRVSVVMRPPEGGRYRQSSVEAGFSRPGARFVERQDLPNRSIHRRRYACLFAELRDAATEPRDLEAF